MRLSGVVLAIGVLGAVAVACSSFGSDDPDPCANGACVMQPPGSEAGMSDGPGVIPEGCLIASPFSGNLETCKCAADGITQNCSYGMVGGASACKGGSQSCGMVDGVLRWSACKAATKPAAKETCFDAVDDDCDGVLNNGCPCGDVPLCKDANGREFAGDTVVLEKTTVKSGELVNIFFLSKQKSFGKVWLTAQRNPSGTTYCGGGGGDMAACASSGCQGWIVDRRVLDTTLQASSGIFRGAPGTFTIKMRSGVPSDGDIAACATGPNTVQVDLTILAQ